MKTKEKAIELVDKFDIKEEISISNGYKQPKSIVMFQKLTKEERKQCALICVDELINILQKNIGFTQCKIDLEYYEEVKQEIEKL